MQRKSLKVTALEMFGRMKRDQSQVNHYQAANPELPDWSAVIMRPKYYQMNILDYKVPSRADEEKFKLIITNLLVKSARAIVLFTRADDAR